MEELPEMDKVERRDRYLALHESVEDMREVSGDHADSEVIQSCLKELLYLQDRANFIKYPDEHILHVRILRMLSELVKSSFETVSDYDMNSFLTAIAEYSESNQQELSIEMLSELCIDADQLLRDIPQCADVIGMEIPVSTTTVVVAKQRIQHKKKEVIQKSQPEEVKERKAVDDDDIKDKLKYVLSVLKIEYQKNHNQPIKLYDFAMTTNYWSTVENVFNISTLVHEGSIVFDLTETGTAMIISPTPHNAPVPTADDDEGRRAVIAPIPVAKWKKYNRRGFLQKHQEANKK